MHPPRIPHNLATRTLPGLHSTYLCMRIPHYRHRAAIHTNGPKPANVVPVYGTGPPPEPPVPSPEYPDARIARRRRQAELLRQATDIRAAAADANRGRKHGKGGVLKRRFWKEVSVREVDGAFQIHLDDRPLRRPNNDPNNREIIRLPLTKPYLAHALALEWDQLVSAEQATRQHLLPLTSLICRALDIADDDKAHYNGHGYAGSSSSQEQSPLSSEGGSSPPIRTAITTTLLRYLDTDSLLCWAPAPSPSDADPTSPSLRSQQEQTAGQITAFLTRHVWPGLTLEPVLEDGSIVPRGQRPGVRDAVRRWVLALPSWELAGLERATLAGKGLLGAARLVVEWSDAGAGIASRRVRGGDDGSAPPALGSQKGEEYDALGRGREEDGVRDAKFGVGEAAMAASLEVDWQTRRWGEVEDTHDVDKEDLRRQLGSVILLVSGTRRS